MQKTLDDLEKEQKQPLLAGKTTSQKTQRKKWSLFSSKSSGKQQFEEEKENNTSIAQTATDTNIQGLQTPEHAALSHAKDQHSPLTISNGVSGTIESEDASRNTNSRNSQEKLGNSEPSSAQDVYQNSKQPDSSLELSSAEQKEMKQANELNKKEEANLGLHDSTEDTVLLKQAKSKC